MPGKDLKVSVLLNGGIDNRSMPELVAPLIQQGESPKLIESTNTRLSKVPGTCARSPKFTKVRQYADGKQKRGLFASTASKLAVLVDDGESTYDFISGSGEGIGQGNDFNAVQRGYAPLGILRSGDLDGLLMGAHVSIGRNSQSEIEWRAYIAVAPDIDPSIWVSAWSSDGSRLAGPTITTFINDPGHILWTGITNHGADGDYLWYYADSGLVVRRLHHSNRFIAVDDPVTVVVPGQPLAGVDVMSDGGPYAYLAHAQNGSTTGATVRRVDPSTGTTTHSVNIAGALVGGGKCAVHVGTLNSLPRVAAAFSAVTGSVTTCALYTDTLSVVGAPFSASSGTPSVHGDISCCFYEQSTGSQRAVLVAISNSAGDFSGSPMDYTDLSPSAFVGTRTVQIDAASWGATSAISSIAWMHMQSHFVTWALGSGRTPVLIVGRTYGNTDTDPGEPNYVDDPCLVAYSYASGDTKPVARFGTVRGNMSPAYVVPQACLASRSAVAVGNELRIAYLQQPRSLDEPIQSTGRFLVLDLAPTQKPFTHDKDGSALLASALPTTFDGTRFFDTGGPLHAPKLAARIAPGSDVIAPGAYSFVTVFEWIDNTGGLHRSRPSNVITHTLGAGGEGTITLVSTAPDGLAAEDSFRMSIALYATEANGASFHLYSRQPIDANAYGAWFFGLPGDVDGGAPEIYSTGSDGEEILPQPPPPLRDITTIGPRAWGIDAEVPSRGVYSKLRVSGIGYEFFPAGEVNMPSEAGDALAVRGWQGLALFLCERGVFQVAGDGPSNNATGGDFSQPIKLSDIGCTNTASVVSFPGGILWQSGNRFAMLSAAGIDYVPNFNCAYDVTLAFVLRRFDEVLFFSDELAEVRVYNYSVGRWTTWDQATLPAPVTCGALLPYDPDSAFVYAPSVPGGFSALYRLDADSVSTAAHMTWETDWTLLGGDFQDHVLIRDVIFNGMILGPHSITIEIWCDYEGSPSTTRTWDSTELTALANGGRYTVRVDPKEVNCRAVKLRVYDTVANGEPTPDGVQPRSLTIVYAIDGMLYETAFVQGSHK